jgi:excisionase family DNA binding protein
MTIVSEFLTIREMADLLSLRESTLRAWVFRKKLPYCKFGRSVRIERRVAQKFIDESRIAAR